jgi:MinD superfamily P-loop ATPase
VDLCPEGVLGLDGQDKAVVLHPEACTACLFCELHCPDLAVEVQVQEPGVGEVQVQEPGVGELEIGKRRKMPAEGPRRSAGGRA